MPVGEASLPAADDQCVGLIEIAEAGGLFLALFLPRLALRIMAMLCPHRAAGFARLLMAL